MFSEKRAITPVIATLLLIAITVAAVAGFYIFYNNFIRQQNVGAKQPSIAVSGPNNAASNDVVTISVKNSGNVDITTIVVATPFGTWTPALAGTNPTTFQINGAAISATNPLKPGQVTTASSTITLPTGTPAHWEISVEGRTAAGSSVKDICVINQA